MSYEGRYQTICKNSHYNEYNCYEFSFSRTKCSCGESFTEINSVDDTNEIGEGYDKNMEQRANTMQNLILYKVLSKKDVERIQEEFERSKED